MQIAPRELAVVYAQVDASVDRRRIDSDNSPIGSHSIVVATLKHQPACAYCQRFDVVGAYA